MHFHQIINSCLYTHHADLWVSVDIMCAVSRLPVLADVAVSPWLPEREQQQQHTHNREAWWLGGKQKLTGSW